MCGLFAIIPSADAANYSYNLYILGLFLASYNVGRGKDSFGMWCRDGRVMRHVGAVTTEENARALNDFLQEWGRVDRNWIAGHTRLGTAGAITVANQHPFEVSNLLLAHNGMVDVEGFTAADHIVDSARIAMSLVANGYEAGFKSITGTCGLLFSVSDKLYAYRSNQTLFMASGDWGWAISSNDEHLRNSLNMASLHADTLAALEEDYILAPWEGNGVRTKYKTGGTGSRTPRSYTDSDYSRYGSYGGRYSSSSYTATAKICDICGKDHGITLNNRFELTPKDFPELEAIKPSYTTFIYDICNDCVDDFRFSKLFKYMKPKAGELSGYWTSFISKRSNPEELPEPFRKARHGNILKKGMAAKAERAKNGSVGYLPILVSKDLEYFPMSEPEITESILHCISANEYKEQMIINNALLTSKKNRKKNKGNEVVNLILKEAGIQQTLGMKDLPDDLSEILDGDIVPEELQADQENSAVLPPTCLFGLETLTL